MNMRKLFVACVLSIPAAGLLPILAGAQTLPHEAIVNGHDVQPRADQFGNRAAPSDIPQKDAGEVNRLYEQLMRETDPVSSRR